MRPGRVCKVGTGKRPLCLLCRVVSQIPLQCFVADLLAMMLTHPQQVRNRSMGKLRGNVCNGFLA